MKRQLAQSTPRRARPALVWLFILVLFAALWQYGWIGGGLRRYLLPRLLPPLLERQGIVVRRIADTALPAAPAGRGLQITLSRAYVMDVIERSPLPAWIVPPGLVSDGMEIRVDWLPPDTKVALSLPCVLRLDANAGLLPRIHIRFPVAEFNTLLSDELAEDWSERGEYILGHYDLDKRIWFRSLRLELLDMPRPSPSDAIRLRATATGRLRYWFKDGIVSARLKTDVKRLAILFSFVPVVHDDGTGFDYSARVEALDIRVDNMAPWLEQRVADALGKSIERSQNKRRKKAKMARHRLPSWLPLDVSLEVELTEQLTEQRY